MITALKSFFYYPHVSHRLGIFKIHKHLAQTVSGLKEVFSDYYRIGECIYLYMWCYTNLTTVLAQNLFH